MKGVLLVNIGTPSAPDPYHVGRYLSEFLMDPEVIDIPYLFRWILVHAFIVPKRKFASAALYQKVWSEKGSPLLNFSQQFTLKLDEALGEDFKTYLAMRYGEPPLIEAIKEVAQDGVSELIVFPLYPQYSLAATLSAEKRVKELAERWIPHLPLKFVPPFFQAEEYLEAVAEVSRPYLARPHDLVLFSFHGLPERQVKKTDSTGRHCLTHAGCCDTLTSPLCYRAQCFATAREIARRLSIEKYEVCFQSRLGRTPWIKPFTDELYRTLPSKGVKKLLVICASFVADCLETLEEVSLRGKAEFIQHGGEELTLVPSLNAEKIWVSAAALLAQRGGFALPLP